MALLGLLGGLTFAGAEAVLSTPGTIPPVTVSVWSTGPVDGRGGSLSAVAVDDGGVPHLLYVDAGNTLWYATPAGDAWAHDEIAHLPATAPRDDLAFDVAVNPADGRPYLAYVDIDRDRLLFGELAGDAWQWQEVAVGGRLLSMRFDSSGVPHLALTGDQTIRYLTRTGGDWTTELIDDSVAYVWNLFLVLDGAGRPHVAGSGANGSFYGLRAGPGVWLTGGAPLDNIEGLAVDPEQTPYFLETRADDLGGHPPLTHVELWLTHLAGSEWQSTPVAEGTNWAVDAAIAADADGAIHVAYIDPDSALHYLRVGGQGAAVEENPFGVVDPRAVDVALDGAGRPFVSYSAGGAWMLARRDELVLDRFVFVPAAVR